MKGGTENTADKMQLTCAGFVHTSDNNNERIAYTKVTVYLYPLTMSHRIISEEALTLFVLKLIRLSLCQPECINIG